MPKIQNHKSVESLNHDGLGFFQWEHFLITFSGRQNQSKRVERRGKYFINFIVTITQNIELALWKKF